jgi:hypothetical protein
VPIAKNGNSFLFLLDNLAHEQRTTIKSCAQADDKRQGPTVCVTDAFPVFTDENSQLFNFRWSFSARAYPFRHPRLSWSGTAECSMPRAKVPDGADRFARDCSRQGNGASRVVVLSTARDRAVRLSSFFAASRRHRSSIDSTASGEVLPNRLK